MYVNHSFENVKATMYFASLADYNKPDTAGGEYLTLLGRHQAGFHALLESPLFRHHSIYLMFTHLDVFDREMKRDDADDRMRESWPSYRAATHGANGKEKTQHALGTRHQISLLHTYIPIVRLCY